VAGRGRVNGGVVPFGEGVGCRLPIAGWPDGGVGGKGVPEW
jgi:hypothetical protein